MASLIPVLAGKTIGIASQSLAELHYGALERGWGRKRYNQFLSAISHYLIIDTDNETTEEWAKLSMMTGATGRTMSAEDLWVLATAVRWQLPILTSDKAFGWHEDLVQLIVSIQHSSTRVWCPIARRRN